MFQPKFTITNRILNNLLEIAEVHSLVNRLSILPKEEAQLKRQALIRMVYHSTSIEGNPLNQWQVEQVLGGKKVIAISPRDRYEVENYRNALQYISEVVEKKQEITTKTILEIHRLVTEKTIDKDKCGQFRKDKVYVVERKGKKTRIVYTAPEACQVPKLTDDLVVWLNKIEKDKLCPVIVAGLAHYQMATIHPFSDGNGRTARALATLILYQRSYDFHKLFALEDYYNKNRKGYYKALNTGPTFESRQEVNLTNWIEYFVEGFAVEMRNLRDKIIPLSLDAKMRDKIGQIYLGKDQIKVVDFVVTIGRITRKDIEDVLNVSKRTAVRTIKDLLKIGVLVQKGKGKSIYYILPVTE